MQCKNVKKRIMQVFSWILAIAIGFAIVNSIVFFYYNRPAWLMREEGATSGIYHPNQTIYYAYEGFGINTTDKNGYVNPQKPLAEQYILTLGASHTQGKEVMMEERYTSLLNEKIGNVEELTVYNMAVDGNYYPQIVQRFGAALEEFSDSEAVIIEIGDTDFSSEELQRSLQQIDYSVDTTGESLMKNLSLTEKVKVKLKESMPLSVLLAYKQLSGIDMGIDGAFLYEEDSGVIELPGTYEERDEAYSALDATMKLMRKLYSKPIIIMYHPEIRLCKDGSMEILYGGCAEQFEKLCKKNGIYYIDMGNDFLTAYEESNVIPYGFMNSAPASGHLNKDGHEIIADRLYQEVKKIGILDVLKGDNVR